MTSSTGWENLLALIAASGTPAPAVLDDDWDDLISLGRRHGMLPLLYRRCRIDCSRPLPPAAEDILHRAYLRSMVVNTRMYHQLASLLLAMNESGMPVIVLKGASLAEVVYGDIALRPMSDLDLLVRREDLPRVEALCRSLGYARPDGDLVELANPDSQIHHPALKRHKSLPLEWHWTIAHRDDHGVSIGEAETEALWSRSLQVTLAGVETRILAPDDLLLHECLHLANNHLFSWHVLRGLTDISMILQKYGAQLDWGVIERRAQAWGSWHGVSLALWLTHDWLNAPLSDTATSRLRAALPADDVVEWVRQKMSQLVPAFVNDVGLMALANMRWQQMPARIIRSLFPPPVTVARLYGRPVRSRSRRIYLYYPRRIIDVIRRGGAFAYLVGRDREKRNMAQREMALRRWLREESHGRR